ALPAHFGFVRTPARPLLSLQFRLGCKASPGRWYTPWCTPVRWNGVRLMAGAAGEPSQPPSPSRLTPTERALLPVLVDTEFTHMVAFLILMPRGDRLRRELAISPEQFGAVVAAYAWAAGVASLLASLVMDRFDRRTVILTMYAGFGLSTLFCGLAA